MKERGIATTMVVVAIVAIVVATGIGLYFVLIKPGVEEEGAPTGLQIVFKDQGIPEVKHLQPTITKIQLQREDGEWITLWSDPSGITLTLTADGAEVVLDTVSLDPGTYIGTRLRVTTIGVKVDVNRDGDTLDKNVEIVVPEGTPPPGPGAGMEELEQIKALTDQIKPLTDQIEALVGPPGAGPPGPLPPEVQAQVEALMAQVDGLIAQIKELIGGELPRVEGGLVYTGQYLDEEFTVTWPPPDAPPEAQEYIPLVWEADFVYDGSGGKLVFDLTLHPLKPPHEQISVKVFATT